MKIIIILLLTFSEGVIGQIFQYFIVNQNDQTAKVIDTIKLPTCTHLDTDKNVTLRGGINAGKFTKHAAVKDMKTCIDTCCQDQTCSVAFMPGKTCYTVACKSEKLCEAIPATPSTKTNGSVQISHIVRGGGKGDEIDQFRKQTGIHRNSVGVKQTCVFSRVAYNHSLVGGKRAGELIDLGTLVDIHDCAQKCCEHENCEVAYIAENKCYAIDCFTEDLCQSQPGSGPGGTMTSLVYVNKRNNATQKDKDTCVSPCVHGICTKWDTCMCDVGYKGVNCNETEIEGICDPKCGANGRCIFSDSCACNEGWEGYKCDKKMACKEACKNGFCIDKMKNICKCDDGWTGRLCNESSTDTLVMASSGEEVLFTDDDIEPEFDMKIHESPFVGRSESISAITVAVACGVGAAVLGTAAIVFIVRQFITKRTASNYELLNSPPAKHIKKHDP